MSFVCPLLGIYQLVLIARAITSFFPVTPGTPFGQVVDVLYKLTEPIMAPMRRIIPPLGMFDLSFLVVFIALSLVMSALGCRGLI